MKSPRSLFVGFALVTVLLTSLALVPLPSAGVVVQAQALGPAQGLGPAEAVAQAWQNALASGTYAYRSTIDQTTYPAPMLSNAGRGPSQSQLALAGRFDQWAETLDFTLWRDGSFNPNTGLSLRVENGQAYARAGIGAWEPVEDFTASFAPGGDPLAFLTGITNIQEGGRQTYDYEAENNNSVAPLPTSPQLGGGATHSPTLHSSLSTLNYTIYTFDLNGPAFARYLREQLEKELAAKGALPRGLSLETPETYKQMTGQGTLWVDANGLPARLQVVLDLGPQANSERVTAQLQTDFADFDLVRVKEAAAPLTVDPESWWQARLRSLNPTVVRAWAFNLGAFLLVLLASALLINAWHRRRAYVFLVLAVIFGMVITPLIDAQNVYAFTQTQQAKQAEHQTKVAQTEAQAQAAVANQWDPHQDPLADGGWQIATNETNGSLGSNAVGPLPASVASFSGGGAAHSSTANLQSPVSNLQSSNSQLLITNPHLQASSTITSTDTDNDGLSDADEALWYTCAYAGASYCSGVANSTDSDGDGLTDGQEVNGLGTLPTYVDTDGDTISDTLEVKGFNYNGVKWYLNPSQTDSNSDGLPDAADCPVWSQGTTYYNAAAICPDTDGDGAPDVFDDDNDGDAVVDADDASPNRVAGPYTDADPFKLAINGLQTNKPVLLTLQFRPTDPSHLTYSSVVLDWPTSDTQGQITRYLDTTFANTANSEIRTTHGQAANGDVRVIPLLEITMPYSAGHYANLPVKPAYLGISRTLGLTVGQWLNPSLLDPYAISVKDVDETSGELVAYVPINTVASSTGENTVAFSAQMVYSPTQAGWGAAHEFRVVWLVQMLTDACIDPAADPETCARQDELRVIHAYKEDWQLTGLEVSEEHGLNVGILYENPAQDPDLSLDHQLWAYSWNLGNNFVNGRDCDSLVNEVCVGNGQRDVTVANLATVVPTWSTGNYVAVNTYSYLHTGYLSHVMMTATKSLLNSAFAAYTNTTYPTFIFAQELNRRTANLGDAVAAAPSGQPLTLDLAGVATQTVATLSWATYQYAAGAWGNLAAEDYLVYLDAQLATESYFQPAGSDAASPAEANGKRIWAQAYYVTLLRGVVGLVLLNNSVTWTFDNAEEPELMYVPSQGTAGIMALNEVAGVVTKSFSEAINRRLFFGSTESFWKLLSNGFEKRINRYSLAKEFKLQGWAGRVLSGMAVYGAMATLAVAGIALYAIGYFTGNQTLQTVGTIFMRVSAVVLESFSVVTLILKYRSLNAAGDVAKLNIIRHAIRVSAVIGFVVALLITWGFFAVKVLTGAVKVGTVAFGLALAYTIASSIIALLNLILIMVFPIAGTLLLAVLGIIDLILQLFGEKSLTMRATQALADLLYDVDIILSNLDDGDRLALGEVQLDLVDPARGFEVGNGFYYTVTITNTIRSDNDSSDARRATFIYVLQTTDQAQHSGLEQNQMPGAWTVLQDDDPARLQMVAVPGLTTPITFASGQIGLNRNFSGRLYLTEAYAAPYEGCWTVGPLDVDCTWYDFTGSNHLNLGADLVFDILPDTVEAFVAMRWNLQGSPRLPAQTDQDGDGLLSAQQGGADPNDLQPDTDGDGLSDKYEVAYNFNPSDVDGDDDGLSDYEEVAYTLTDPADADTDDDGLPDYTEVKTGWLTAYGYAGNTPLLTRVWSDPNFTDADTDTLSDLEEFTFGFNPNVASDPSVIKDIIGFSNMGVAETNTPLALWRLEEGVAGAAVSAFADTAAGAGHDLHCARNLNQCPPAGNSGRYGSALLMDGVNDQLTTTLPITLAKHDFSLGAWVKTTQAGAGIITKNDGDTTWEIGEKTFYINNTGQPNFVGFGNSFIRSTQTITDGQWHHVMVVWDYADTGVAGIGKMYVDGVDVTNVPSTTYAANNNDVSTHVVRVGRPNHNVNEAPNYFNGSLDEVIAFDRALSAGEVYAVMRGRYNPNDQLLTPGQTLNYHTTITNTHPSQSANGFLIGTNTYAAPAIAQPNTALRFEDTDYVYRLTNGVGESYAFACPNNGTCPTTARTGKYGQALDFDGVNDALTYPAMSELLTRQSLAFWLKLEALPVSGTVAQLLTTDRTENGAVNVYVDANAKLWFTIQGNVGNRYLAYYPNLSSFDWAGYHFAARPLTTVLGVWTHYVFVYNGFSSQLYVNGERDSTLSYTTTHRLRLGPGIVGNNLTRTAPLNAQLDEFVVYDEQELSGSANSVGKIDVQQVMNGTYWLYESYNNVADVTPTTLFRFDDKLGADGTLFYDTNGTAENAYCTAPGCPAVTAGYNGNGVVFDGVDDSLGTDTTHTAANQGVNFRIKVGAWPLSGTRAMLLDSANGPRPVDVSLDWGGHLVVSSTLGVLTSTRVLTPGVWVHVRAEFAETTSTCSRHNYDLYLYFDNVFDRKQTYWCQSSGSNPYVVTMGPGRIGSTLSNTLVFSGVLDDFNLSAASYTFDITGSPAVQVLDHLEGDNAACTEYVNCPTLTTGKYGLGLAFSGDDYLTLENEGKFDYHALSVGAWIKVAPGGFTTTWQALITKGDGAWRLQRYNNTNQVSFGTTGLSNLELPSVSNLADGQWHYVLGVYDGAAKYIYVDGVLENMVPVTGTLAKNNSPVWVGENAEQTGRKFVGVMDEVILLPEAVYTDGVRALMNTRYPPILIPDSFITYTIAPLTATVVSGTASVEPTAHTSVHRFQQTAEAALALQSAITIPVVDNTSSLLKGYFPFEDVPGVTTFENLVSANDMRCSGDNCPVAGLRGIADRAVYFDGVDDVLTTTVESPPDGLNSFTVAAWVKADEGTLVDGIGSNLLTGLQLDVNRLYFRVRTGSSSGYNYSRYTVNFDLPENEWTHLVATLNTTNAVASIYMNGALVVTGTFNYPAGSYVSPQVVAIGANRFGGDYLHGYLDDLRIYNQPLTASQVQALYAQSTPALRFEFDEDTDATTYADATPYKAVGYPRVQTCADFSLKTATVNTYAATTDNVYVQLDTEYLLYDTITNAVANTTRNLDSVICASTPMTVAVVSNTGATSLLGTLALSPTVGGNFTQTFSSGGNSLTLAWFVGAAYNQPNPPPGTDGQIGNTGLFDGVASYITISPTVTTLTSSVAGFTNSFTLMGWINPDRFPNYQWILATGRGASNNGFAFGLKSNRLLLNLFGVGERVAASYDLDTGIWQHVAVVFDSSYDTALYVDGVLRQVIPGTLPVTRNTDDPLYIGASTSPTTGLFSEYFNGQIDELAVYSRTLSTAEIYSIYLRELRWYRDRSANYLTVDDDAPSLTLLSTYAYRPNAYTQLAVGADDPTSNIGLLDFGLKAPGAVTYTWRGAPLCLDTASTWCPAFDPSTLNGEGAYQLQFRAVDSVGNESTSNVYTLLIDATPPTPTSAYASAWLNSSTTPEDELSWVLPLSGTVTDPAIGVTPGSGVYTESVRVSLVDARGEILGGAAQPAWVTGTTWSLNYAATGLRPSGVYTVQVYAEDNVGNAMTTTLGAGLRVLGTLSLSNAPNAPTAVGTIRLDERAPAAQFATWAYPTTSLTTTTVLTGLVGDYADWGGERVQLHLEETSGNKFYDYSGNNFVGQCVTCPVRTGGVFGNARQFTGTQRAAITLTASAAFSFTDVTLAAWVRPTWTSGSNGYSPAILAVRSLSATHLSWHLKDNYTGLQLGNGSVTQTLTTTLTPGQWYHLAVALNDGVWTGYVNGLPVGSVSQTLGTALALPLNIGSSTGAADFFTGVLDEVTVFGRALSADEVYALAQKEVTGVSRVQVGLEPYSFTGITNTFTWQTATLGLPGAWLTTWAYTLPAGLEDFYQINLRAQDGFSNTNRPHTIWRGIIDQVAPRLTFTATHRGGGTAAQTVYTFTVNDKFLDTATLVQPCVASSLAYTTYLADSARISGVRGNGCRVEGHVTGPVTLTACDIFGHCAAQTITLTAPPPVNAVSIITPTANSVFTLTPTTVAGGAYATSGVLTVTVKVDANPLAVLPFSGSVTNTLWSTTWTPFVSKTYTLTAVMNTVANGTFTDTVLVRYAPGDACFAEITGDNDLDYASPDAAALRAALAAASVGSTIKLAGNCGGVITQGSTTQLALITKTLTIRGGYAETDWQQSYPLTQPTRLDAQGLGRVLSVTAPITLENMWLLNGYMTNTVGGGLHTTQPITLTGLTFYSNTVTGTAGLRQGGGAYLAQLGQISATAFLSNTAFGEGGGAYVSPALNLTNSLFLGNVTSNTSGGGLYVNGSLTENASTFQNNRALQAGADGAGFYVSGVGTVNGTQFIGNLANDRGGGAYFGNLATVQNIIAQQNQASWGGGVFVGGATGFAATVTNALFMSNTTTTYGGGLFANNTLTLTNSSFISNTADAAGGGAQIQSVAHIANTTFVSNSVRTSNGGGLFLSLTGWLTNTTFTANATSSSGGGLLASAATTLTHVTFTSNTASISGGGAVFNGAASVTNTVFHANRANGNGGGAYFNNANARQLVNVRLTANSAPNGAALYVNNTSSLHIVHTTIASPTLVSGAAIRIISGTVVLTNTLIASHTVGLQHFGGVVNENYTLFSNVTTPYSGGSISSSSLTGTAAFYDTTAYTLTALSQAIDAGVNAGINTDYFGTVRPQAGGVDIGYNEALFAAPHWLTPTVGVGGSIAPSTPQLVADGASRTFTITPDVGYHILDVGIDGVSLGPMTNYSFTNITANHTLSAVFALNTYTLTVDTAGTGSGVVTPTVGIYTYTHGTVVTLTAIANAGSTFTGWSVNGAPECVGLSSCVIVMGSAHSVTATFELNLYNLTVATAGPGTGALTLPAGVYPYPHGSVVTLTATADAGSTFVGWSGHCSGLGNCVVTLTGTRNVTATFTLNSYALTVTTAGAGSGVVTPTGVTTHTHGTLVALTATANLGSTFVGWNGGGAEACGPQATCVVVVTADQTVTATFDLSIYTLTPLAGVGGSIVPTVPQTVTHGGAFTFTIAPDVGYHLTDLGVDGVSLGPVTSYAFLNVTADHVITTEFALTIYTITPTAGVGGSIVPTTPQTVTYGEARTFTITPDLGYHLVDVGVDGVSQGAMTVYEFLTITADHTLTATFALDTFTITPTAGTGGSLSPATPQTVNYGTSFTFTITPNTGYHIVDVGVDGVSLGPITNYSFPNITADHTITAVFAINTYTITPIAGVGGSIAPATPQTVNYGTSLTFTITPNTGYHIVDVGVDGVSLGPITNYSFPNISADHTITAVFAINTYTLTVASAGTGSGVVTPTVGVYTYTYGTVVTLTATANSGSAFMGWSSACSGTGVCVVTMTSAQSVTATFDVVLHKRYLPFVNK